MKLKLFEVHLYLTKTELEGRVQSDLRFQVARQMVSLWGRPAVCPDQPLLEHSWGSTRVQL